VTDAPEKLRLGGMALRNGLLVHGPTHWAAAVRNDAGEIEVASGRKPRLRAADPIPGVRGIVRLAEAFVVIPLVKRALPAARLPFQDPGVVAVAAGASVGGTLLRRRLRGAGGEAAAALVGFMPALFALRGGDLAAYHGVEHKAIGAYEADDEDAADATKEHDRCGSHLVAPMLASNLAGHAAARARRSRSPGRSPGGVARRSSASRSRSSRGASATPNRRSRGRSAPGLRDPAPRRYARAGRAPARGRARPRWPRSCAPRARPMQRDRHRTDNGVPDPMRRCRHGHTA
jgi:hypothetical protein